MSLNVEVPSAPFTPKKVDGKAEKEDLVPVTPPRVGLVNSKTKKTGF